MDVQQNFIDGRFLAGGGGGERIEVLNPARDTVISEIPGHARGDGRRGRGLGQAGAGRMGEAAGDQARGLPAPDLGQDPRQCRADRARDLRGAGQGPGPRPGRGRVHRRLYRLHGRVGAPDRGRDHPERPAGREHLPVPPADRRGRRHPALELPVLPDRAQAGAGPDHRQHDRHQAVRGDAQQRGAVREAGHRDRAAAGRVQHGLRPRRHDGPGADAQSRRQAW